MVAAVAALGAAFLAACGDAGRRGPIATASPVPAATASPSAAVDTTTRPPSVFAESLQTRIEMPPGSWCWGIACADALAFITRPEALSVERGASLRLASSGGAPPIAEVLLLNAYPRAGLSPEPSPDGSVAWTPPGGFPQADQPTGIPIRFTLSDGVVIAPLDLASGEYILSLMAGYATPTGESSYDLLLNVR